MILRRRGQLRGLRGLGDATPGTDSSGPIDSTGFNWDWSSIGDSIVRLQTIANSQALFNENLRRASQNLPPLNAAQYAPQVGISYAPTPAATQMLILGGIGLVALLMLSKR